MPRTAGLSRKKKKKPAPTSGAFSLKLLPAAGAGRIRARGPRALKLGRRQRPPPVRPGWATWGRGDVLPPGGRPRAGRGRGDTRGRASPPPRGLHAQTREPAPGRRRPGLQTTRRTSAVRRGAALLVTSAPPARPPVLGSVRPQPPPHPRVPTRRANTGARPRRHSRSWLTSGSALTAPQEMSRGAAVTPRHLSANRQPAPSAAGSALSAPRRHCARARARTGIDGRGACWGLKSSGSHGPKRLGPRDPRPRSGAERPSKPVFSPAMLTSLPSALQPEELWAIWGGSVVRIGNRRGRALGRRGT